MKKSLIEINNLTKKYHNSGQNYLILDGLNLKIHNSEIISIIGPSGVGKTTLLNIIGLLDTYNSGQYAFNNMDTKNMEINLKYKFRNEKIGFIHQFFHLIPELSVVENVALPKMISGKSKKESFLEAEKLLDIFGLNKRKFFKPSLLSGGEQQRVSIARALINKPQLLIADEMTGNLDERTANDIFDFFLSEIKKNNQTVVFATHNIKFADLAEKKLELSNGKIIQ